MKQLIVLLSIITLTAFESISQGSNDTVCLPIAQVNKAIVELEKGKIVAEELVLTKKKVDTLEARIRIKDSSIAVFKTKDAIMGSVIADYKKVIENQNTMAANLSQMVELSEKKYRREKRNKWVTVLIAIGGAYLISR